ncbi:MAG: hypothetical protein V4808_07040 [Pseudomonadota bacterium]
MPLPRIRVPKILPWGELSPADWLFVAMLAVACLGTPAMLLIWGPWS